jgi:hypothetical protein
MTGEELRLRNSSLHDRIERVLEMHPELRDGAEAIALRQDLHVEVGAPFLERTHDKLQERASAIIERRPELEHYFEGVVPAQACRRMTPREAELTAALDANAALPGPGGAADRRLCGARVRLGRVLPPGAFRRL